MADAIKSPNSARPGAAGSPVPGKNAADDLDAFLATNEAPQSAPADAGAALDQFTQGETAPSVQPQQPGMMDQAKAIGGQVLDKAGRILDAPGGVIRTGLAEVAGLATGQPNTVTPEDLKNMTVGKAPNSAEYLRRLGVPEGGSFTVPGTSMKVTARGASGLALDIATDPLTALSKLAKEVPYIGKLMNTGGAASEAVGESIYKSALSGVDKKLAKKGAGSVGEALIENGAPVGGLQKLEQHVNDISSAMGKVRQGLYDKAAELGVTIDSSFPLKRAEAVLEKMKNNPGLAPAAQELEGMLNRYKAAGKVGLDQMSEWKTSLYDSLPASAFDGFGKVKGPAKQFKAALAGDFRDAIIGAGNKAEKGLGDAINHINEKWGTLLAAKSTGVAKSGSSSAGALGKAIDTTLLGTGHIPAFAVKKSAELATTPFMKTLTGRALMEAGQRGMSDALLRRSIIDSQQTTPPVLTPMAPPTEEVPQ